MPDNPPRGWFLIEGRYIEKNTGTDHGAYALAFSTSIPVSNASLPTGARTTAVLSARNSILPALISRIAFATSTVTAPVPASGISSPWQKSTFHNCNRLLTRAAQ